MFWWILSAMLALALFPSQVSEAVSDGALEWWTHVFPALTPYLILTGLALRARPRIRRVFGLHPHAVLAFSLGALGGYPVGARVLGKAEKSGAVSLRDAQRFSYAAGLPSPGFLISVTAIGLFGSSAVILPLACSIYPIAIGCLFLFGRSAPSGAADPPAKLCAADLSASVSDAMQAILSIGGCMLLCRALGAVFSALGVAGLLARILPVSEAVLRTVFLGLVEMTGGCIEAAALPLPLCARLALCVFFQMFGGVSILLQTRCFLRFYVFGRYVLIRFFMALAAAALCYAVAQFLPDRALPAVASADAVLRRAETLLSAIVPCAVGLIAAVFTGMLLRPSR